MQVLLGSIPTCGAVFSTFLSPHLDFCKFFDASFFSAAAGAPGRRPPAPPVGGRFPCLHPAHARPANYMQVRFSSVS